MRRTALLMLVLACVLGGLSVYLAHDWLQGQPQSDGLAVPTTSIVVAKRSIRLGDPIVADLLKEVKWPTEARPEGSFSSLEELVGKDAEKRVALRSMEPNEPVLKARVSGFGGRATLSTQIPDGKRAFTIRANDVVGVAGFVLPGDRVDVLLTRDDDKRRPHTDIILQNIRVLGIDQDAAEDRNKPQVAKAVTLEVTAVEAQKVALASKVGQISLALRNESNTDTVFADTINLGNLSLNGSTFETASGPEPSAPAAAAPAAPRPASRKRPEKTSVVTIFRALKSSVVRVASESAPETSRASSPSPQSGSDAGAPIALEPSRPEPDANPADEAGAEGEAGDESGEQPVAPAVIANRR